MIKLYNNNSYKWNKYDNVYVIGYVIYNDMLYENKDFADLVLKLKDKIENIVKEFEGYFAIVIKEDKETILISDIIRSFPLFYNKYGDVTDDIELLKEEIDNLSLQELLHCRWVSVDNTIYKDVFQIENAQIIVIKDGKISKERYFKYRYCNGKYSYLELDKVFNNMTQRMVKYLRDKTAVIPLSGGQDSRLLLYYLKMSGYNNIITYTYGNKNSEEAKISKKVAEFLDVKWHFIEYKKKSCRKLYNKSFSKIAEYFGRGYAIPHIQELEAIDELIKRKIVNNNCIIIPGFSLDFLAGSHLISKFIDNNKLMKKVLKEEIYKYNYNLCNKDNSIFDKKLEEKFQISFNDDMIETEKIVDMYNAYDFEERQAKYVNNAIRVYDYYGLKWYLPFWDKEVIGFWSKVSLKDKFERKFFNGFVNYKYEALMKYAPVLEKKNKIVKNNIFYKIKYIFMKYYRDPLNFYYYFKYSKYLKYAILQKNTQYNYFVANDYVKYIRRKVNNFKYIGEKKWKKN